MLECQGTQDGRFNAAETIFLQHLSDLQVASKQRSRSSQASAVSYAEESDESNDHSNEDGSDSYDDNSEEDLPPKAKKPRH